MFDGRSNLVSRSHERGVALPSSHARPGLPDPTRAQRRKPIPEPANLRCDQMAVRFAVPRATRSLAPGTPGGVNPHLGSSLMRNLMVLSPYSKSFFGQTPIRDHPDSVPDMQHTRNTGEIPQRG